MIIPNSGRTVRPAPSKYKKKHMCSSWSPSPASCASPLLPPLGFPPLLPVRQLPHFDLALVHSRERVNLFWQFMPQSAVTREKNKQIRYFFSISKSLIVKLKGGGLRGWRNFKKFAALTTELSRSNLRSIEYWIFGKCREIYSVVIIIGFWTQWSKKILLSFFCSRRKTRRGGPSREKVIFGSTFSRPFQVYGILYSAYTHCIISKVIRVRKVARKNVNHEQSKYEISTRSHSQIFMFKTCH